MLLFKPEHVEPILKGLKTQTRRIWKKPRVLVGSTQKAKTVMLSKEYFALLKITGLHHEVFQCLTEEDAKAEGGYTKESYLKKFWEINPKVFKYTDGGKIPFNVWVVDFVLLTGTPHRVIQDSDDWAIGTEVTKDKQTYFRIISKIPIRPRWWEYGLELVSSKDGAGK
jgi:hypothetical protein